MTYCPETLHYSIRFVCRHCSWLIRLLKQMCVYMYNVNVKLSKRMFKNYMIIQIISTIRLTFYMHFQQLINYVEFL